MGAVCVLVSGGKYMLRPLLPLRIRLFVAADVIDGDVAAENDIPPMILV